MTCLRCRCCKALAIWATYEVLSAALTTVHPLSPTVHPLSVSPVICRHLSPRDLQGSRTASDTDCVLRKLASPFVHTHFVFVHASSRQPKPCHHRQGETTKRSAGNLGEPIRPPQPPRQPLRLTPGATTHPVVRSGGSPLGSVRVGRRSPSPRYPRRPPLNSTVRLVSPTVAVAPATSKSHRETGAGGMRAAGLSHALL